MSGPTGPFDGASGDASVTSNLPWPSPATRNSPRSDRRARPTRASPRSGADAARRRSAQVRRRRRIVAVVGGASARRHLGLRALVRARGQRLRARPGRRSWSRCTRASRPSSVIDALSQQGVIGSSLAFRISEVFHGTPTVLPGSYALHQNLSFSEVRALLAAGPNIYPVDVRPGFTLSEVAQQVDSLPGHAGGEFAKAAASGAVHSVFSPPGSNNLEGMLGTGDYLVLPGESDPTIVTDMVQRFDHDAHGGRPEHGVGGRARADAVPGDHRRLHRGEGGLLPGQHAQGGPGHLQPAGPGHPAADGLDRALRARPGRRAR